MTSIAILVGITKSQGAEFCALPVAEADVKAFHELLEATGRFDHIEPLIDVDGPTLLGALRELTDSFQDVEEVFFYYSGHGVVQRGTFHYVLEGFVASRPGLTGISYNDMLSMLRLFNPKRAVVVMDACQSGIRLLKSTDRPFQPEAEFGSVIIFSACGEDETAPAGLCLSAFTNGFIEAIQNIVGPDVYYLDIANGLRDVYGADTEREPFINATSAIKAKFCDDKTKLQKVLQKYASVDLSNLPEKEAESEATPGPESEFDVLVTFEKFLPSREAMQLKIEGFQEAFLQNVIQLKCNSPFFEFTSGAKSNFYDIKDPERIVDILKDIYRLGALN